MTEKEEKTIVASNKLDDNTVVFSTKGAGKQVPWAKIYFISGPESFPPFECLEKSIRIGRTSENHLILEDSSVSRNHACIYIEDKKVLLKDLNSTRGVYLENQKLLDESASLGSEERIKIGNFQIHFMTFNQDEPTQRISNRALQRSSRYHKEKNYSQYLPTLDKDHLKLHGMPIIIFLAAIFLSTVVKDLSISLKEKNSEKLYGMVTSLWKSSMIHLKNKDLNASQKGLRQTSSFLINANFILPYMQFIKVENDIKSKIDNLDSELKNGNLENGKKIFGSIPEKTIFMEEKKKVFKKLKKFEMIHLQSKAKKIFEEQDLTKLELLKEELEEKYPGEEKLLISIKQKIEVLSKSLGMEKAVRKRKVLQARLRKYKAYDKESFAGLYGKMGSRRKNRALEDLESLLAKANLARSNQDFEEAFRIYKLAAKKDYIITKSKTNLSRRIRYKMSSVLAYGGEKRKNQGDWKKAGYLFNLSLKFNPKNNLALRNRSTLEKKAKQLYKEAYVIYSSYGSGKRASVLEKLNTIFELLKRRDPIYQKALRLKDKIK